MDTLSSGDAAVMQALHGPDVSRPRPVAGDALLHPVALIAISLLLINDHFLKAAYPGLITGKMSDFAGLVFFPLLLVSAWETMAAMAGQHATASPRVLLSAVATTAALFIAIKTMPIVSEATAVLLGSVQVIFGMTGASRIATDPSDLIALPSLVIAYMIGKRRL